MESVKRIPPELEKAFFSLAHTSGKPPSVEGSLTITLSSVSGGNHVASKEYLNALSA